MMTPPSSSRPELSGKTTDKILRSKRMHYFRKDTMKITNSSTGAPVLEASGKPSTRFLPEALVELPGHHKH